MKEHIPKREIKIYVPKAKKAEIMAHADSRGESMNSFINRAIDAALEKKKEEAV